MLYPSLLQLPAVDGKPGKNLPTMHSFCRSTTLAILPSEEDLDKAFGDFKADNIPEGMDFDEWLDGLEPTEDGKLVFRDKSSKATVSESKSDIGVVKGSPLGNSEKYLSYSGGKRVDNGGESGIINEDGKKPITDITEKSINKVPKVNISGYTDEECEFIYEQHKALLEYSRDSNSCNEVAFVFRELLKPGKPYIGTDDSLDFGELLYGTELFVMHNHPRNNSFSLNDISFFCNNSNVKTLTIVKNNGRVEYITKSINYNSSVLKLEYDRLHKDIIVNNTDSEKNKLIKKLLTKTRSGVIWSGG